MPREGYVVVEGRGLAWPDNVQCGAVLERCTMQCGRERGSKTLVESQHPQGLCLCRLSRYLTPKGMEQANARGRSEIVDETRDEEQGS